MRWREFERAIGANEPVIDPWEGAREVCLDVLARRERRRLGLSRSARVVLWKLSDEGGTMRGRPGDGKTEPPSALVEAEIDLRAGLDELVDRGFVRLTWIAGDVWPPVPAAVVVFWGELPPVD